MWSRYVYFTERRVASGTHCIDIPVIQSNILLTAESHVSLSRRHVVSENVIVWERFAKCSLRLI